MNPAAAEDRKAVKTFNRCINRLKDRTRGIPRILEYHARPHIEEMRKRQKEIIATTEPPRSAHYQEQERYEREMFSRMEEEILQRVTDEALPKYHTDLEELETVLERLADLRRRLENRFPSIRRLYTGNPRYKEWKGCKVIVTSDRSVRQSNTADLSFGRRLIVFSDGSGDADSVLVTDNPYPVVWLMYRLLRQEGRGFIDFQNKFELFARIVETAKEQMATTECDSESEEQKLLLRCLQEPVEMVTECRDYARRWIEEFEEYLREQRQKRSR